MYPQSHSSLPSNTDADPVIPDSVSKLFPHSNPMRPDTWERKLVGNGFAGEGAATHRAAGPITRNAMSVSVLVERIQLEGYGSFYASPSYASRAVVQCRN